MLYFYQSCYHLENAQPEPPCSPLVLWVWGKAAPVGLGPPAPSFPLEAANYKHFWVQLKVELKLIYLLTQLLKAKCPSIHRATAVEGRVTTLTDFWGACGPQRLFHEMWGCRFDPSG